MVRYADIVAICHVSIATSPYYNNKVWVINKN